MYNEVQIKEQVRQFILKTAYLSEEQIKEDTLIFVHGILDSMGFISLISFIEEAFSVKANDSELLETNFESINAISAFVISKLNHN